MIRRLAVAAVVATLPTSLGAQTAEQLLSQARQAFENIDFEQAARLFTRVLDVSAGATAAQRDTAQLYLGVSYEYAGQRTNAVSAFRLFVRGSPCATTPEQYGAGVTSAYVEAQGGVFAAGVCEVQRQEATRATGVVFRVAATRPATVSALLLDSTGRTVADFGEVPAVGVAQLRWTELPDPSALPGRPTRHQLLLRARAAQGTETDERTVLVDVHAPPVDTANHPLPPSPADYRLERRPMGPALGDFGKAVAIGASAVTAAAVLAHKSLAGETGKALAVGGAISLAGLVALVKGSGQRDIAENRAFNEELRSTWNAERDSVATGNQQRRAGRPIIIEPATNPR